MIFFLFDDKTEPADIFADIPSEKTEPKANSATGTTPLPVGESGVIMQQATFGKKGIVLLAVIVLLIGGGAAAYFVMRGRSTPQPVLPAAVVETPQPQTQPQPEPQPEPQPQPESQPQPQPATETPATQPTTDTDGDGLSDAREVALGTNPNLVDTDADNLNDREEVEVYLTDPLNPDTDGDTFKDGDEVRNGYNPKGPGKLLQLPTTP